MTNVSFSQMNLTPSVEKAVSLMGFDCATPIQSQAIPVIRTGVDVIARSQTGTGKTIAFAIPAIEAIDSSEDKSTIQALIVCPTRELAQQACEEIRKLTRFSDAVRPVAIYGGAPIARQCIDLRRANLVVGTPGRIMDHMRRKTIKLNNLKLIVLDEADEMLNMGFKEDIETILVDTPIERQTVLFSATMPPAIMKITKEFQKDPALIEIDKGQVTIENIKQRYIDVPHTSKKDALAMLLQYYRPNRAIVFCGTKRMADELTGHLKERQISAESIHSDISQAQRTNTMRDFKGGKTTILIATDIAARGIDVNNVEYVINFDIPQNAEYYVHRIGRTGRAGKDGCSITVCSNRREINEMRKIAVAVKSDIKPLQLPTPADIQRTGIQSAAEELSTHLQGEINPLYTKMLDELLAQGHSLESIAQAALSLHYSDIAKPITNIVAPFKREMSPLSATETQRREPDRRAAGRIRSMNFGTMRLDIGAKAGVGANHIIGAITERTGVSGKDIGKIDIIAEQSFVEISSPLIEQVVKAMKGCKIRGKAAHPILLAAAPQKKSYPSNREKTHRSSRTAIPAKRDAKRSQKAI